MKKNPELDLAYEFVQYTNRNIFLTGKAGTGKTTFLRSLKERTFKRLVIVAPTGVAAINAGGVTIHSFFQLPFGPIITERVAGHKIDNPNFKQKFNRKKINIIKSLDLLIIDEISMVRADMLDAIDEVLRRYKNRFLPFGGVQLLMIGDLQQLSPVVKDDEWGMLSKYYKSMYFFNSKSLEDADMVTLELKHVYRQSDDVFLDILNEIRNDRLSQESFDLLHKRYIPGFSPENDEGYITLTTHNNSAKKINDIQLDKIKTKSRKFKATVKGNFSEHSYPTEFELELKVGSQVMFVKNDSSPEKRYFNGKIGEIRAFEGNYIIVKCLGDDEEIETGIEEWENIRYSINSNTKEISEEFIGSFAQFPLRLAWAITIHKSQGLTFEKAIIDAAAAFAHGQTYVALSRCKTMEGLVLSTQISESAIICDKEVNVFNQLASDNQPDSEKLKQAKYAYQLDLLLDLFNYKQLNYRLQRLERALEEHKKGFQGDISEKLTEIQKNLMPEISSIAQGFINQINKLLLDNADTKTNTSLQERIKKAAVYFHAFHEDKILKALNESRFESDNKSVKKTIKENLTAIDEILTIKQKSLKSCFQGFEVKDFLEVRAKSAIADNTKAKKEKTEFRDVDTIHPDLYSLLKYWRREEGDIRMVPLFQVASNKMLQGIANELPTTSNQLLAINGIGKKKVDQYGIELIEMVMEYLEEKGITPTEDAPEVIKVPKKKNHEISYELYKDGKEIKEIAKEMGYVVSTIESHLSRYVATGDLDVDEFVEQKVIDKLIKYFEKNPEATLGDAKIALPDSISYGELKLVQKHLEFIKNSQN